MKPTFLFMFKLLLEICDLSIANLAKVRKLWPAAADDDSYLSADCSWQRIYHSSTDNFVPEKLQFYTSISSCFHRLSQFEDSDFRRGKYIELKCKKSSLTDHKTLLQILTEKLRGKSVSFIGDSIMRQQFTVMACMIDSNAAFTFPGQSVYSMRQLLRNGTVSLKYHQLGRAFSSKGDVNSDFQKVLDSDIAGANRSDIVIVNHGIHHTSLDSLRNRSSSGSLYSLGQTLLNTIKQTQTKGLILPLIIWRETTPQHYPTSNGWYTPECRRNSCQCTRLTPEMIKGDATARIQAAEMAVGTGARAGTGTVAQCLPICIPANARNRDIVSMMTSSPATGVTISPVYNPLSQTPANLHRSFTDCTHWGPDALIMMNTMWLSLLNNPS